MQTNRKKEFRLLKILKFISNISGIGPALTAAHTRNTPSPV